VFSADRLVFLALLALSGLARAGSDGADGPRIRDPERVGCFRAAQATISINARRQRLESQVYRAKDRRFQLLMPTGEENRYRIESFATLDDAMRAADGHHPLNLRESISAASRAMLDEVLPVLQEMEAGTEDERIDVRVTQRAKDLSTLKAKIFGRVAEKKSGPRGIDLSMIDDLAGARVILADPREIHRILNKITRALGADRVTAEHIDKPGGYRAAHLTVHTKAGPRVEIQVMSERISRWSDWDHDRVYKTTLDKSSPYYLKLKEYGTAIGRYLRALDDGIRPLPPKPSARRSGVLPVDAFPPDSLR
jgi:ppGpp synthetase/RelA/SpoT-type nucleotidyltranferase